MDNRMSTYTHSFVDLPHTLKDLALVTPAARSSELILPHLLATETPFAQSLSSRGKD